MNHTLLLARQQNFFETVYVLSNSLRHSRQLFQYLLVLDFEATCWDRNEPNKGYPEIIEFPCVLFDVMGNKIVAEFQQYVMPMERPRLSDFCTQLTGITQSQVDKGVPLKTCLMLFDNWLKQIQKIYDFSFKVDDCGKKCVFVTWSDWDLGTCLYKECRRKHIITLEIFNRWIDVRALYKSYYARQPKGLLGALYELGLTFEGKQHCGLHDARNTAKLIGRMIQDGVLFTLTKDISDRK